MLMVRWPRAVAHRYPALYKHREMLSYMVWDQISSSGSQCMCFSWHFSKSRKILRETIINSKPSVILMATLNICLLDVWWMSCFSESRFRVDGALFSFAHQWFPLRIALNQSGEASWLAHVWLEEKLPMARMRWLWVPLISPLYDDNSSP